MPPPVRTQNPVRAVGDRLVALDALPESRVVEVETEQHGTLAVGLAGEVPFAVSNVCRHQFAKLGRGWVDAERCLVCPWHRARYDVQSGEMLEGPKGRIFGFPPYAKTVQTVANAGFRLRTHAVVVRDGAIYLSAGSSSDS
jgi:3-phenylpropionate/trans-cinnamate dioxygenase ferredoxin component